MNLHDINELTRVAYNNTAQKYHDYFKNEIEQKEYDRGILDKFSALLAKESLICDVGCGPTGQIAKYLCDKGHKVIGIDISEKCIELATRQNPNISFRVMDMMKTDFEDQTFEGIISFYSIIYTPKVYLNKMFKEFNRILKSTGKILVVVKKGANEGIIDDEWYESNRVYFTQFYENEIITYLSSNQFQIDLIETRKPYDFEIKVDRIYALGTKIN